MKVMFYKGLPASGKSTEAKRFCEKNPDWIRVNRDDLRNMRGKYWLPKQEKLITKMERNCIILALSEKKNVIVDATNLNEKYLNSLKLYIKGTFPDVEFSSKFFEIDPKEAIKRDLKRANSVGADVIMGMYDKYLKPPEQDKRVVQDKSLPPCIICDLDGTIAIHNDRSPFEYDKCDTDLPNEEVVELIKKYMYDVNIIYLSGREDTSMEKTRQWLSDQGVYYDWNSMKLFMRKKDDYRKDCIIKEEIFRQEILGKYYVKFLLDDRNQVVDMWRSLGLKVFQVNEGDF